MTTLLLENASTVVTVASPRGRRAGEAMGDIGVMRNADVAVRDETIVWVGEHGAEVFPNATRIDCRGLTVLPGFVDSHTHIVHAGNRSNEFARRLRGASYQEIAREGGGILSTMRAVRGSSVDDIVAGSRPLLASAFRHGTTTIEAKSGYGLDTDNELKLLEAISQLETDFDQHAGPSIIATFLGAHDFPPEHRDDREGYIAEVIERMIPEVAQRKLAQFCDVFSDTGYYTVPESERIFEAARGNGLGLKVHADELSGFGGAEMAARVGAISADHLLMISDEGIRAMREANVVATLLPGTAFFLGLPYAPARKMIAGGMVVALASDCNPGSNMCENMGMTLALACMGMKMTVEEAITAATINGAAALGIADRVGSIEVGKRADMIICNVADYPDIIYHYGVNHVALVVHRGRVHDFR